jgi:hypothetical protein
LSIVLFLLNHFICAIRAGEGMWFGPEGESHSVDIPHCHFLQHSFLDVHLLPAGLGKDIHEAALAYSFITSVFVDPAGLEPAAACV